MALRGPILIVEDDLNDTEVIQSAILELKIDNEIKTFAGAQEALDYLMVTTDKPLVILCDIRMPRLDGLAFLRHINNTEYLKQKAIPFVFLTGFVSKAIVDEAYIIGVQGFFEKARDYAGVKEQLYSIFLYWIHCLHPNTSRLY